MSEVEKQCDALMARMHELFTWAPDKVVFDDMERWHSFLDEYKAGEEFSGDCDDFMLTCADVLIDLGLDPSRLMAAVCETKEGDLHAVLVVDGRMVLDNRQREVRWIEYLPYKWIKSMSGKEPGVWREYI